MATRKPENLTLPQRFSVWLRTTREAKGITRGPFRDHGVTPNAIKALEDAAHDPKLTTFVAACNTLGRSPSKVLALLLKEDAQ